MRRQAGELDQAIPGEPEPETGREENAPPPSNSLEQQGWTERFTAIGFRLNESVSLYRQLGFEVHLEPAGHNEELFVSEACQLCFVTTQARTIYTRLRAQDGEDLPGKG
jgi:hypothetical protein